MFVLIMLTVTPENAEDILKWDAKSDQVQLFLRNKWSF